MERAVELGGRLQCAGLQAVMREDEVEELGDAGRIRRFLAAIACRGRAGGVGEIDQGNGKLVRRESAFAEAFERGSGGVMDQFLEAVRMGKDGLPGVF